MRKHQLHGLDLKYDATKFDFVRSSQDEYINNVPGEGVIYIGYIDINGNAPIKYITFVIMFISK